MIWAACEMGGGTYSTHERDEKLIENICLKTWNVSTTWVVRRIRDLTTKIDFREIKCHFFLDWTSLARNNGTCCSIYDKQCLRICTLKTWRCYSSSQSRILCQKQLHCQWDIPTDFLTREGKHVRKSTSARTLIHVVRNPSRLSLWNLWNYQLRFCEGCLTFFFLAFFFYFVTSTPERYLCPFLSVPWLGL